MIEFLGKSKPSLRLQTQLELLKRKKTDVFFLGETGTGRDFCVHYLNEGYLLKLDAEFISDFLETFPKEIENLYIDGLENLPSEKQIELLWLLDKRETKSGKKIRGRLFFSAKPKLQDRIKSGHFREDILLRISTSRIDLPSLQERKTDIPIFIQFFLEKYNLKYKKKIESISPKLQEILFTRQWTGNLSELEAFIERQILFSSGRTLDKRGTKLESLHSEQETLDLNIKPGVSLKVYEKAIIETNLHHFQGNRSKTAQVLGLSERHLYRKIKEFGLNSE
jgi:DNA-binding NtrC family response regulator